jgi:phosphatidylglycerophosphate synthase
MFSYSQIPNMLSASRLAAAPVLLVLALGRHEQVFAWLLAAALISDILDGLIARRFGWISSLGTALDSAADICTFGVAAFGVWRFHPELVRDHGTAFALVVALWLGTIVCGLWRYGRLASFHTYLSRATAYAIGAFLAVLFIGGFVTWLFWFTVALAVISHLEEFVLMALLPAWTPNVRGVYWVWRRSTTGP